MSAEPPPDSSSSTASPSPAASASSSARAPARRLLASGTGVRRLDQLQPRQIAHRVPVLGHDQALHLAPGQRLQRGLGHAPGRLAHRQQRHPPRLLQPPAQTPRARAPRAPPPRAAPPPRCGARPDACLRRAAHRWQDPFGDRDLVASRIPPFVYHRGERRPLLTGPCRRRRGCTPRPRRTGPARSPLSARWPACARARAHTRAG